LGSFRKLWAATTLSLLGDFFSYVALAWLVLVLDEVSIPVLAAGGIGRGRGIAAVLAAGASGVRMGTRFIAAAESNAHPDYVTAVISAQADDSVRTNRFEVECPLCPSSHGVLRSALEAAEAFEGSFVAELASEPVARFRGTAPYKGFTGNIGAMACYSGQSVGEVRGVQPAAEIVAELLGDAEKHLRRSTVSA
jgi:NAD(P)H-dependent flavin oxidoreductase YrpB (nitropropane dioxygenase family)